MNDLSLFYAQHAGPDATEDFIVSDRFRNGDGQAVPWELRSMSEAENEECRKAATKRVKMKNGAYMPETNYDDYLAKLTVASVIYPNLKDSELQRSYGVLGAEALLRRMLLPGEYAALVQKVQAINGYDKDLNELVDDVKN